MLLILTLIAAAIAAVATGHVAVAIALTAVVLVALAGRPTTVARLDLKSETGDVSAFIPEFWVQSLLTKLRKSLVYGQPGIVNTDYEGTISGAGDTVHVNSVGAVTIKDHDRTEDIDAPEELSTDDQTLLIDQEKYFNFSVNDVNAAQAAGSYMNDGMEEAAFGLRDVADQFIASAYTDVHADNLLGDDTGPESIENPGEAYEAMVELAVLLDEANVPDEGRWVVVPPWYHGLIQLDNRFVGTGGSAAEATLANGQVGQAAGFRILKSNNTPVGEQGEANENSKVIAGYRGAYSYAEQINDTEAYRPERRFSDAVKGLHVYGGKLFRAHGWAVLSAQRS